MLLIYVLISSAVAIWIGSDQDITKKPKQVVERDKTQLIPYVIAFMAVSLTWPIIIILIIRAQLKK